MSPVVIEYRCACCWLPCAPTAETCGKPACVESWRDYSEEIVVYATAEQTP